MFKVILQVHGSFIRQRSLTCVLSELSWSYGYAVLFKQVKKENIVMKFIQPSHACEYIVWVKFSFWGWALGYCQFSNFETHMICLFE